MILSATLPVLALSLAAVTAAPNPNQRRAPVSIPLVRRTSGLPGKSPEEWGAIADFLKGKYAPGGSSSKRRSQSTIGMTNQNGDSSYFGRLSIGTPAQQFNVILDTGSAYVSQPAIHAFTANSVLVLFLATSGSPRATANNKALPKIPLSVEIPTAHRTRVAALQATHSTPPLPQHTNPSPDNFLLPMVLAKSPASSPATTSRWVVSPSRTKSLVSSTR